jgi:hypothetical protein
LLTDEAIAIEVAREWLGEDAQLTALLAMNSSTWEVSSDAERYVLKIAAPTDAPGLAVAAWLDGHGLSTGRPLRTTVRGDRLVALLEFVDVASWEAPTPMSTSSARRWVGRTRCSSRRRCPRRSTAGRGRGSSPT